MCVLACQVVPLSKKKTKTPQPTDPNKPIVEFFLCNKIVK